MCTCFIMIDISGWGVCTFEHIFDFDVAVSTKCVFSSERCGRTRLTVIQVDSKMESVVVARLENLYVPWRRG